MSEYIDVIVETYRSIGENSGSSIRARPVAGQGYPATMKVACSKGMRNSHPIGTKLRIHAKVTDREGGEPFLYTNYNWAYSVISDEEAENFIRGTIG